MHTDPIQGFIQNTITVDQRLADFLENVARLLRTETITPIEAAEELSIAATAVRRSIARRQELT